MAITRTGAWQSELSAYLVACAHRPFRYGLLDCGLFVADAVRTMTGVDVAAELRGRYENRAQAFAAVRALCGAASIAAAADYFAAEFGILEIPVTRAQRGDAVQLRTGRHASLGIVAMHGTEILTPYAAGILRLPLSHATRAWRI